MTVDLTAPPPVDRSRKAEILLGRDLALMATAARYDLADRAGGERSVRDLTRLFFDLAEALEVDLSIRVIERSATLDRDLAGRCFQRAACRIGATGAARAVLTGGARVLERAAVVMVEVEDRRYWSGERWPRPQVLSYLYDRGLVPVARDFQSRYRYHIVLVRAELLDRADAARAVLRRFNPAGHPGRPADGRPGAGR